ncbi:MAG: tetratricopeptide repeat protein [Verrucomicrobia bacterium]|nr:tetratricopeptide repeat protein [Verrucomicrobiota bacterium]
MKMKLVNLIERQDYFNFRIPRAEQQHFMAAQGLCCLDDLATNSIPALVEIYKNSSSVSSKDSADFVLKAIYPASGGSIPYWVPSQKRAEWYYDAGQTKSQMGAQSNAILAFSEAIKLNPTNALAYLYRATSKIQLQDFAGALGDVKRTIELDGSNQPAFYLRGWCNSALKEFKNAEADFTRAINMETNDVNSYNGRGVVRANLRKPDEALADFNKAIELSPREAEFYRNRALAEWMQKEYELAHADASKSIELDGTDVMAYVVRGRMKIVLKEYKSALPDLDKAIELNPNDAEAYSARGAARLCMDEFEIADADLRKALQLNPKNVTAYAARGWLRTKRGGDENGALTDFTHAVELGGAQSPEVHAMLGSFQYLINQRIPSLENLRKALDMDVLENVTDARFYIWLIRAQRGEEAEANRELETYLQSLQGAKTNEWEASIARFLSGSLSESNFLGQATTIVKRPSAIQGQVCESLYYAGMKRKLAGDTNGGLEFFQKCLDTKDDNNFGYMNAVAEMRALKNK